MLASTPQSDLSGKKVVDNYPNDEFFDPTTPFWDPTTYFYDQHGDYRLREALGDYRRDHELTKNTYDHLKNRGNRRV